jgi:hypothetical protein
MSELDKIISHELGCAAVLFGECTCNSKQQIKELFRELIDTTFDKSDANAYKLWQKVSEL